MKTRYYYVENFCYDEIADFINQGECGIFPTETVYAIIASAKKESAIKKVYELKKRDANKPLIVLISSFDMLEDIGVNINETERKLMTKFWPDALTIIFDINDNFSLCPLLLGGKNTVAIRYTRKYILQNLIDFWTGPLVAPSANLQGEHTGAKIDFIKKDFDGKVPFFVNEGSIINDTPSTLVKVVDGKLQILREGAIKKERFIKEGFEILG